MSYVIVTVAEPFSPIHSYLCDSYLSTALSVSVIVAVCLFGSDFTIVKSAAIFHSIFLLLSSFELTVLVIELSLYEHCAVSDELFVLPTPDTVATFLCVIQLLFSLLNTVFNSITNFPVVNLLIFETVRINL